MCCNLSDKWPRDYIIFRWWRFCLNSNPTWTGWLEVGQLHWSWRPSLRTIMRSGFRFANYWSTRAATWMPLKTPWGVSSCTIWLSKVGQRSSNIWSTIAKATFNSRINRERWLFKLQLRVAMQVMTLYFF